MLNAKVVGFANATIKHPSLQGQRMLLLQPYGPDGQTPDGDPVIAIDTFGAGEGCEVIVTSDGSMAREILKNKVTPVRWTVIGIKDA